MLLEKYDIRASNETETVARSMSGGNQQKAIVAREIEKDHKLLIAVCPTRGLDIGAINYIHKQIIKQRDMGKAILLVSFELDEIMNLSDKIAVIHNGQLTGFIKRNETDEKEIGLMMTGALNLLEKYPEKRYGFASDSLVDKKANEVKDNDNR